jgi:hypothetical protein
MVPVPYVKAPESRRWKAWFTASRSMIVQHPTTGALLSVKLPTDHPTPHASEPHKADLVNHTTIAVARGAHVRKVEASGGGSPSLTLQPDIGAIWEKGSRNGFIVRDISSFLDEDHYYMPGFALPRYGIAYHKEPEALVARFAEISAQAKANLLLNYGLWMKSPHGQNTVLQMTKSMEPTGRVVFRDLSDTSFVPHVARALGFDAAVGSDVSKRYSVVDKLTSDWSITIPGLDHNGYVNYSQLTAAKPVHDRAFARAVGETLAGQDPELDQILEACSTFDGVDAALRSEAGQRGLRAYAAQRCHRAA